jgi:hypothetical protein
LKTMKCAHHLVALLEAQRGDVNVTLEGHEVIRAARHLDAQAASPILHARSHENTHM